MRSQVVPGIALAAALAVSFPHLLDSRAAGQRRPKQPAARSAQELRERLEIATEKGRKEVEERMNGGVLNSDLNAIDALEDDGLNAIGAPCKKHGNTITDPGKCCDNGKVKEGPQKMSSRDCK